VRVAQATREEQPADLMHEQPADLMQEQPADLVLPDRARGTIQRKNNV
jgi:hypothetical protein